MNADSEVTAPKIAGSIRRRLLMGLLLSTAVFGSGAMVDAWQEARETAGDFADRFLSSSVQMIGDRIVLHPEGEVDVYVPYAALSALSAAAEDRVYFRIDGPAGVEAGYPDLPRATTERDDGIAFAYARFHGDEVRIATQQRQLTRGEAVADITITVAETTLARHELTRRILFRSGMRLAGMILGASLVVLLIVALSLRPLRQLSGAIARRGADDLSPIVTPVPREVFELVSQLNIFIHRLDTALRGMRNFTGNAAHQLRTPLAAARTHLMLAERAETATERDAALAACDRALTQIDAAIRHLRILSRLDASAPDLDLTTTDMEVFIRDLVGERIPLAFKRGKDLGFESDGPFMLRTNTVLLSEAISNLIDNALLHAGDGAQVTVRTSAAHRMIEVEDDGPGLPPMLRNGPPARYASGLTDGTGTGLGLCVVYEIAQFLGAEVTMTSGQGLSVKLIFPYA